MAYLQQLAANLRPADVLDIAVIAILLYGVLIWLRRRAPKSLIVGLGLVAGLFLSARWLDMYLTMMLFQAGFMAVLLTLIVVFQHDIRRAFDRLTVASLFRRQRNGSVAGGVVDKLTESITSLAESRTGALLVFRRREPLERHTRSGVVVDGQISLPLLHSIFHSGSPGHDGAVLIAGERIERLGVHLPLSKNLEEIGRGGTRHAAALGLSERSDALVVVISEERGTISVAENGRLHQIDPVAVAPTLARYYASPIQGKEGRGWRPYVFDNLRMKSASLAMACMFWMVFAYRVETIQKDFVVPIEFRNLPKEWIIDESSPSRAVLTLSGSERAFDMLDASQLTVSFDLTRVNSEKSYRFRTEHSLQNIPSEVRVNQVRPAEVEIQVRRKPQAQVARDSG